MSLTYSGVVGAGSGKTTLGSVEGGLGSMKILRDPPKSGWTRRVDKVGETSSLTEMRDQSGDRMAESIQVYPRGINPFASVSYSNSSNNGGQLSGSIAVGGQPSAKLPYTIMKDGAYRPPVLLQQDLLPLSRLPRNKSSLSVTASPEMADFTRRLRSCADASRTKEVHTQIVHAYAQSNVSNEKINTTPLREPFEVKYVIEPSPKSYKGSVESRHRPQGDTGVGQWEILHPGQTQTDPLHALARTNHQGQSWTTPLSTDPSGMIHLELAHGDARTNHQGQSNMAPPVQLTDTDPYLRDSLAHTGVSNFSSPYGDQGVYSDSADLSDLHIRDQMLQGVIPSHLSGQGHDYHGGHVDPHLNRNLPEYNSRTNLNNPHGYQRPWMNDYDLEQERNIPLTQWTTKILPQTNQDNPGSSSYNNLPPKLQPGGFACTPSIPQQTREQPQVYNTRPTVQKFSVSSISPQTMVY